MSEQHTILEKIQVAREKLGAVILAHYYQLPEIQEVADHVGDSFALSKLAAELPQQTIVFCGVDFMAETAKVLSPEKTVLLPVKEAVCPMALMATAADVARLKSEHPDAAVVSYVNSSTAVKALSDVCCTSANAVKIIRSLPHQKIIFLPDKNLGSYAAEKIKDKEFVLFDGYCPPHEEVMGIDVKLARDRFADALLAVHPECRKDVRDPADFIGSTAQIIDFVNNSSHSRFIIGTERGILHPLTKHNPGKTFHMLAESFVCRNMKKTQLGHLLHSMETRSHQIQLDDGLMEKARKPLLQMLEIR